MTKVILLTVVAGILCGRFTTEQLSLFQWIVEHNGLLIDWGLYALLFFVGLDMGRNETVFMDMKKAGWRILLFPVASIVGTLLGAALVSVFFPYRVNECMAIAAGFGWYSLAPVLLAEYSSVISAICFLANVMRELLSFIFIPIVAKRVGYIETTSLAGAAAMDTCLAVTVRATHQRIVIYAIACGMITGTLVPVIIPLLISF